MNSLYVQRVVHESRSVQWPRMPMAGAISSAAATRKNNVTIRLQQKFTERPGFSLWLTEASHWHALECVWDGK